jgi:hypothetical protein
MHPIQDLFFGGFSYLRQIDMQPICTPTLAKFYSCKKWVLQPKSLHSSWTHLHEVRHPTSCQGSGSEWGMTKC